MDSEFTKIINLINELMLTYDETKYTKVIEYLGLENSFQKDLLNHLLSLTDCNLKFQLLGFYYKNQKLYRDSMEWYFLGAKLNDVICIRNIAEFYSNGYGIEKDYKIALEWFKRGSELNNAASIHNVGVCYYHGYGIEKNYKVALEWFKKAAELNYTDSIHSIGIIYYNGYGVEKDYKIALEWYKIGAELKHNNCINNIGVFYERGYGIEKNCDFALEWYTKGAEQEHEVCINNFIRLFKSDHKIEQTATISNYKNKINTNIISNYKLGLIYEQEENIIEALKCFAKIIQIAKSITWKNIAQNKINANISGNMGIKIALYMLDLSEENNIFRRENDDLRTEILYRPDGVEYMKARNSFIDSANIVKS